MMHRTSAVVRAGYITALEFCGLLIKILQILSMIQDDAFMHPDWLERELCEMTKVKKRDYIIRDAIFYLWRERYIENAYVRIYRKQIRVLRITKKGRVQLEKLLEKQKKDPGLVWVER